MTEWLATLTSWLAAHSSWLGLALLLASFAECLAVIGLLVPGTLILFALAMLAGGGVLGLGETLAVGFVGGLMGDLFSYALGRRYHQNIRRLRGIRSHPEWLLRAELYMQRYGMVSLLVGRFIGPLRPMLPLTAGMLDMPFPRFLLVSLLATAGWALAYLLPGWAAGAALRLPLPEGFWRELGYITASLALLLALSFYASLRGVRHTSALVAMLTGLWLSAIFIGWPRLGAIDQGLMQLIQTERQPSLDLAMVFITRLGDFDAQLYAGVALVLLVLLLRHWRAGLFAGLTLLGTALANDHLKHGIARARPEVLLEPLSTYSLPSGHASAAFALFLTLSVLAGRGEPVRMRVTWLALACLPAGAIALSRVYLGVHWPTDVLAGALLAAAVCAASLAAVQWRRPLAPLPAWHWALLLPVCLGLLLAYAWWELATASALYRYR